MQWTKRHTFALLAAVVGLGAAFLLKDPCTRNDWVDHYQYEHYCYSDILPIYGAHGHDRDIVPYLEDSPDGVNEYPVLTGFYSHGVALLTTTLAGFMTVSYIGLLAAGAGATWALWRTAGLHAVVAWSLAPSLAIHGLTNWDLLAVGAAMLGWWQWKEGRPLASALLFGLGGAAKLYPAFFLPLLFVAALRDEWPAWRARAGSLKTTLKTLAGGTLGFAGPNAVVAAMAPHNWMATWTFHAGRHPDFETPWQAFLKPLLQPLLPHHDWGDAWASFVGTIGLMALVAATLYFAWRTWKGASPLPAGAVVVLVFMLTNRVYSPQYTLWALPMLILLASWRPTALFVAADVVNFLVRYQLFTPEPGESGWNEAWEPWSRLAVNLRWIFLAWATWTVVKRHRLVGPLPQVERPVRADGAEAKGTEAATGPDAGRT